MLLKQLDNGKDFFLLDYKYRKLKKGESSRPERKGFCLVFDYSLGINVYMSETETIKERVYL